MAKVVPYKYSDFGEIRTVIENNKTWFVVEDVGRILGYKSVKDTLRYYLSDKNSRKEEIGTPDGPVTITLVDKNILYDILTHSQKPPAESLRLWLVDLWFGGKEPKRFLSMVSAPEKEKIGRREAADVIVLEHEKFGKIRAVVEDDEVRFVGKDIGKALGYSRPKDAIRVSVAEENRKLNKFSHSRGAYRAIVINKEGLHQFLSSSQKPGAGELEQWLLSQLDKQINESKSEKEKQGADVLAVQSEQGGLRVFENPEFGKVRAIEQDGEPWFVANEVCKVLGYSNPRKAVIDHVDEEDKNTVTIRDGIGNPNKVIINESGLYSLILSSKLPSAKKFKRWVTYEVLPAIRKHGAYLTPEVAEEVLLNPDTIIKIATQLKEEREKRIKLETENKELKPKAEKYEQLLDASGYIPVGKFAKAIGYGPIKLFKKLREIGFLTWNNLPYQEHIDRKRAIVKEKAIVIGDFKKVYFQTLLTPRGQDYLLEKLGVVSRPGLRA